MYRILCTTVGDVSVYRIMDFETKIVSPCVRRVKIGKSKRATKKRGVTRLKRKRVSKIKFYINQTPSFRVDPAKIGRASSRGGRENAPSPPGSWMKIKLSLSEIKPFTFYFLSIVHTFSISLCFFFLLVCCLHHDRSCVVQESRIYI